ncbi:aspartyl/asparaginyl beta-hydroxylase domain-containing protein [Novosphingobium sp. TH158]|uniref:aspartyl/asparaginyl beta-hydroxylase domain-containing protein n=1 Tax=Novosphingobium sp. TH158 TaxID=2067455 RepID=UPI0020B112C2|nr:aspartyl/asparaginyl beta-hydroxylase domain-containing protein [Novosphingobium sp. TH158]
MAGPSDAHRAISEGLAALQARDPARAAALLRDAAASAGEDFPWMALGNAELALGNLDAAETAIDRELKRDTRDVGALLVKGHLRERLGDPRAASSFYQAAANQAAAGSPVPPPLAGLLTHGQRFIAALQGDYGAHLREVVGDVLSPAMREAIDLLTGKSQVYLQHPSVFYYPGLPQKWFYETADFPWLEPMLDLSPAMRNEYLARVESGFEPYVQHRANRPAPNNPLLGKMDWSAHYFWQDGSLVEGNAAACPATMQALGHAPLPHVPGRAPNALWSRLLPGARIAPHYGMLNTRLICHVPVKTAPGCSLRVGNDRREWTDGTAFVFDDSIEHEAFNTGPESRVILLFEIWRPEIPPEDREAIARIFQAIDSFGIN